MDEIERALTIPDDWWQSVIDSVDHTYRLNEPTAAVKRREQARRTLQNRYRVARWKQNNRSKVRDNNRRYWARVKAASGKSTTKELETLVRTQKKCWWCGNRLGGKFHIDHVIPLSRGGSNDISNLRLACPFCNQSKSNKLPAEFAGRLF